MKKPKINTFYKCRACGSHVDIPHTEPVNAELTDKQVEIIFTNLIKEPKVSECPLCERICVMDLVGIRRKDYQPKTED